MVTRLCLGCGSPIGKGSRCASCAYQHKTARRGTPDQRSRFRAAVLARDGYCCTGCGASGVPLEADHIVPIADGGDAFDVANGRTLCVACHRGVGGRKLADRAPYQTAQNQIFTRADSEKN